MLGLEIYIYDTKMGHFYCMIKIFEWHGKHSWHMLLKLLYTDMYKGIVAHSFENIVVRLLVPLNNLTLSRNVMNTSMHDHNII